MAECYFQERRQKQTEKYSGERFLSKGFSRSTGGASVSTGTLGKRVARAPSPAYRFLRHCSQGMPEGHSGRKLTTIIDADRWLRTTKDCRGKPFRWQLRQGAP